MSDSSYVIECMERVPARFERVNVLRSFWSALIRERWRREQDVRRRFTKSLIEEEIFTSVEGDRERKGARSMLIRSNSSGRLTFLSLFIKPQTIKSQPNPVQTIRRTRELTRSTPTSCRTLSEGSVLRSSACTPRQPPSTSDSVALASPPIVRDLARSVGGRDGG